MEHVAFIWEKAEEGYTKPEVSVTSPPFLTPINIYLSRIGY
jgi:hypothetical protein